MVKSICAVPNPDACLKRSFLFSLQTFSTTGGIQKMTRTLGTFFISYCQNRKTGIFNLFSLYDSRYDLMSQYLPAKNYIGFDNRRVKFGLKSIKIATQSDIVILSHINLSLIGIVIKLINPKCSLADCPWNRSMAATELILKRSFLKTYCDKIICVSNFTKTQMINRHQADPGKCVVLNNAVDPFMKLPDNI